jgi:hypothetical protein
MLYRGDYLLIDVHAAPYRRSGSDFGVRIEVALTHLSRLLDLRVKLGGWKSLAARAIGLRTAWQSPAT